MNAPYYSFFSEILECREANLGVIALTGQLITANAEVTLLLGNAKGKMDNGAWIDAAEGLGQCRREYEQAWRRFAELSPLDRTKEAKDELRLSFAASVQRLQELISTIPDHRSGGASPPAA